MKRDEIGSEFWERPELKREAHTRTDKKIRWFISGRTALDHIIKDIKKKIGAFTLAMPSYYCFSMIEPFYRNEISNIRFYDVSIGSNGIEYSLQGIDADVIYVIDYFGVLSDQLHDMIIDYHKNGKIIINDITQSVFCVNSSLEECDYSYCSYRKCFFSNAAMAYSSNGFIIDYSKREGSCFSDLRLQAAKEKERYIDNLSDDKTFLEKFHSADVLLKDDYCGYTPSAEEISFITDIDYKKISQRRRDNAKYLVDHLQKYIGDDFCIIHQVIHDWDSPLFLPIAVDNKIRTELRTHLIDQRIYCPVHWPVTNYHDCLSVQQINIYTKELSLICDQRYGLPEMEREIKAIEDFFDKVL